MNCQILTTRIRQFQKDKKSADLAVERQDIGLARDLRQQKSIELNELIKELDPDQTMTRSRLAKELGLGYLSAIDDGLAWGTKGSGPAYRDAYLVDVKEKKILAGPYSQRSNFYNGVAVVLIERQAKPYPNDDQNSTPLFFMIDRTGKRTSRGAYEYIGDGFPFEYKGESLPIRTEYGVGHLKPDGQDSIMDGDWISPVVADQFWVLRDNRFVLYSTDYVSRATMAEKFKEMVPLTGHYHIGKDRASRFGQEFMYSLINIINHESITLTSAKGGVRLIENNIIEIEDGTFREYYFDLTGQPLGKKYSQLERMENGDFLATKKVNKHFILDKNLNEKFRQKGFHDAYPYHEGVAAVCLAPNQWYLIDENGKEIWPGQRYYDVDMFGFSEGVLAVQAHKQSGWKFLDRSGRAICQGREFHSTQPFNEGVAYVTDHAGGDSYYINKYGRRVFSQKPKANQLQITDLPAGRQVTNN